MSRRCVAGDVGTKLCGEYGGGSSHVSCPQQLIPAAALSQEREMRVGNGANGQNSTVWTYGMEPSCRELSKIIIFLKGPFEVPSCSQSTAGFHSLTHSLPQLKLFFSESTPELDEILIFIVIAVLDCFVPRRGLGKVE